VESVKWLSKGVINGREHASLLVNFTSVEAADRAIHRGMYADRHCLVHKYIPRLPNARTIKNSATFPPPAGLRGPRCAGGARVLMSSKIAHALNSMATLARIHVPALKSRRNAATAKAIMHRGMANTPTGSPLKWNCAREPWKTPHTMRTLSPSSSPFLSK